MHFELSPQQLRERGGLLEQFLDVAFDSSILLDQDGYVLNCGNGATQLTMTRRSGLLGQHVTAFDKVSPFEEVLRTGTAVKNKLYVVQGRRCLQTRIYSATLLGKSITDVINAAINSTG